MDIKSHELCYTTRSGLRIGSSYQRYQPMGMSANDVMWQGVLLGIEPTWTRKRFIGWITYVFGLVFVMLAIKGMKND